MPLTAIPVVIGVAVPGGWIILGTICARFMHGVGLGIVVALVLFVLRYSRITAVHSRTTLERTSRFRGAVIRRQPGACRWLQMKKFSPGSLLGELSAYLAGTHRTATVVADEESVIYHLDLERLDQLDRDNHELRACVHELVETTLAERVSAVNNRFAFETG